VTEGNPTGHRAMSILRWGTKFLIFCAILALGYFIFSHLRSSKPPPKRTEQKSLSSVVAVVAAKPAGSAIQVVAMGTVVPARQVNISPEVSGRIVRQSPELVPGGRFKAGDIILRIDSRDYELAVKQQMASVAQAELKLAQEAGLKAVAEKEWSLIKDRITPTEAGRKLALREIQIASAQASLDAAKSQLEQAELRLSRTVIRAPFNALVIEESVDLGQVLGPGSKVATLVDSDHFWVRTAVPVDRLGWIRIPGLNAEEGAPAQITHRLSSHERAKRPGRVLRLLADLDPQGKMARVIVDVRQPLVLETTTSKEPQSSRTTDNPKETGATGFRPGVPLLLGSVVEVRIEGPEVDEALEIPRMALRDNDHIWIMAPEKTLDIRRIEVVWAREHSVFVRGELKVGEQVITSRLSEPVEGMAIKLAKEAKR